MEPISPVKPKVLLSHRSPNTYSAWNIIMLIAPNMLKLTSLFARRALIYLDFLKKTRANIA